MTLKFVPIALSLLFVATLYGLGARVYDRRVGVWCAGCAALSVFLVIHSVKAYGYTPVFLLGNLLLLTATGLVQPRQTAHTKQTVGRMFIIGLLMGLLFWAHPVGLIYICVVGLWLLQAGAQMLRTSSARAELVRNVLGLGVGAVGGLVPVLLWNVRNDWATLRFLLGAESGSWGEFLARLERMRAVFPILLGSLQSSSNAELFWTHAGQRYPLYVGGMLVGRWCCGQPSY